MPLEEDNDQLRGQARQRGRGDVAPRNFEDAGEQPQIHRHRPARLRLGRGTRTGPRPTRRPGPQGVPRGTQRRAAKRLDTGIGPSEVIRTLLLTPRLGKAVSVSKYSDPSKRQPPHGGRELFQAPVFRRSRMPELPGATLDTATGWFVPSFTHAIGSILTIDYVQPWRISLDSDTRASGGPHASRLQEATTTTGPVWYRLSSYEAVAPDRLGSWGVR